MSRLHQDSMLKQTIHRFKRFWPLHRKPNGASSTSLSVSAVKTFVDAFLSMSSFRISIPLSTFDAASLKINQHMYDGRGTIISYVQTGSWNMVSVKFHHSPCPPEIHWRSRWGQYKISRYTCKGVNSEKTRTSQKLSPFVKITAALPSISFLLQSLYGVSNLSALLLLSVRIVYSFKDISYEYQQHMVQ